MEKSKNYNFNLPNSANDEIADINDISDNFRIIDEIMNETDQTFKPTSTKAASGKAVNEAISGIQPIDENTEFIFDGGDVDGGVSVDIVVDTVLSKTSNNPIANKAVAIKFGEILGAIEQIKKEAILAAHPLRSLYWSDDPTDPAALFGGTWERVKDVFLLAAGDTYLAGDTGGEATHTLTVDEMPIHNHNMYFYSEGGDIAAGNDYVGDRAVPLGQAVASRETHWQTIFQTQMGGSQSHNNMPPYLANYCWRRIA